jgi:hypothetical protein
MPAQWALVLPNADVKVRRGCWYRILRLGALEVTIEVNRRAIPVRRSLLQIAQAPVSRWSIVSRPRNSIRFPSNWGASYAVCPGCRERAPLEGHPSSMRCARCNGMFDVDWNAPYLQLA